MISQEHPFHKKKKISLSVVFISFISLSMLLTMIIALVSSTETQKESLINNTLELNYSTAQQMSQTMDTLFESMSSSLRNVSRTLVQDDGLLSNTELANNLNLVRSSSSSFNSIMAVDEKGQIRAVSPETVGESAVIFHRNKRCMPWTPRSLHFGSLYYSQDQTENYTGDRAGF